MPAWIPAAIGAIGSVAGAILDRNSQDAANKANAQNVRDQIAFQDEQSKTQYQRAVADIKKAGLNPALAYAQGGNSSESGAAARAEPTMKNSGAVMTAAVDSYQALATGSAQRELLRAQTAKAEQERLAIATQTAINLPEAEVGRYGPYRDEYKEMRLQELRSRRYLANKTDEKFTAELGRTNQETASAAQQARLMRTQATLNEQNFQNVWFRKNVAPYLNSTAKTINSFKPW